MHSCEIIYGLCRMPCRNRIAIFRANSQLSSRHLFISSMEFYINADIFTANNCNKELNFSK